MVRLGYELCSIPTAKSQQWRGAEHVVVRQPRSYLGERLERPVRIRAGDDDAHEMPKRRGPQLPPAPPPAGGENGGGGGPGRRRPPPVPPGPLARAAAPRAPPPPRRA